MNRLAADHFERLGGPYEIRDLIADDGAEETFTALKVLARQRGDISETKSLRTRLAKMRHGEAASHEG